MIFGVMFLWNSHPTSLNTYLHVRMSFFPTYGHVLWVEKQRVFGREGHKAHVKFGDPSQPSLETKNVTRAIYINVNYMYTSRFVREDKTCALLVLCDCQHTTDTADA